ncbi:ACN9 protein-like protein, mitochondrial precursor [Geranomyces variabilis]|nr:ACN9 protein-like protein, mitochondrial precursor [Geranomyces variabilis]KAJ3139228.1 acetate non-utilizing protein 9 [Geranomyces variabilis]
MSSARPPVLELYKSIRRLHKRLPPALRAVGNNYVKDEFQRHKKAEPAFVKGFMKEWMAYRDTLRQQVSQAPFEAGATPIGRKLQSEELDSLSHQQLGQLHALKKAAKGQVEK